MNDAPFKSWIIANFDTLANVLIAAIWLIGSLIQAPSQGTNEDDILGGYWLLQLFVSFLISIICGCLSETSAIGFMSDLIRLLVSIAGVAFFIFCMYMDDTGRNLYYYSLLTAALIATVVGGLTAIVCARFAYVNFEEVVSRRMRYRNSNVDLFDVRWKYTFNRFVLIFCYFIIFIPLMTLHLSVDWGAFFVE